MMYLDTSSAFTPPPALPPASPAIYEPADSRGKHPTKPQKYVPSAESGATTDRVASPTLDPQQQYEKLRSARVKAGVQVYRDIAARVSELITDAVMTNEPVSQGSLKDLFAFLSDTPFTRRPAVYLLDNGNFRVVWKGPDNEQAAFQFRGNNIVHCVFFFRRAASQLPLNLETVVDLIPNLRSKYPSFARLLHASPT
jgi:hypothetical protein